MILFRIQSPFVTRVGLLEDPDVTAIPGMSRSLCDHLEAAAWYRWLSACRRIQMCDQRVLAWLLYWSI
jgi:hypothetical protein